MLATDELREPQKEACRQSRTKAANEFDGYAQHRRNENDCRADQGRSPQRGRHSSGGGYEQGSNGDGVVHEKQYDTSVRSWNQVMRPLVTLWASQTDKHRIGMDLDGRFPSPVPPTLSESGCSTRPALFEWRRQNGISRIGCRRSAQKVTNDAGYDAEYEDAAQERERNEHEPAGDEGTGEERGEDDA